MLASLRIRYLTLQSIQQSNAARLSGITRSIRRKASGLAVSLAANDTAKQLPSGSTRSNFENILRRQVGHALMVWHPW
ncbi:hypothetical protein GCM10011348_28520 [Marinobacterium nitratireducens]|uniref:Uncharacterized protein n=1 Tax=Marinobacterium nitratireducens TaxID=518897 RepID=A0A917ZIW8_9GAMM|nr:hypothetical protein GCM10011348_28520 [Marinobacterium nitratireducens]